MIEIKWDGKQCGVYCIRNTVSDKRYIGSSVNCYHRIKSQHLARLRSGCHTNPHLQSSFKKYGEKAFEYFIIELCEKKDMLSREQYHIDDLKCLDRRFGFNANQNTTKPVLTSEQCEKIRLSKLGRARTSKHHVGVHKSGKNWMASIGLYGQELYLGSFSTPKKAKDAYLSALQQVRLGKTPSMGSERVSNKKPVLQTKGDITIRHESVRKASSSIFAFSSILECCHGKRKDYKGFVWSFA